MDDRGGALAVRCDDLVVSYDEFIAVDRVSFEVAPGEIYGLLGPNGAGKTSVIRALTTILDPTSGGASVAGHPLEDEMAVRLAIGVLPESNGYPNAQSAHGYLKFYGQLFGASARDAGARADQLLQLLGLGEYQRQRISTFSRGMRQRLGLCRALVNRPTVLFLDEPTLGLDPSGQEDILAYLARTATEDGTSVVLCSHLLDKVERVCDRVGILDKARIVADGTVDEVIMSAGIGGHGKLRVSPTSLPAASGVLNGFAGVVAATFDDTRPGDVTLEMAASSGFHNDLIGELIAADVEIRSFDLQGARLSEAFRVLTNGPEPET